LYNKASTVRQAIRSVVTQSVRAAEVVVVDDGSTDGGGAEVVGLGIANLRLITQTNAGVSAARNRGMKEAGHDVVAFLDADDQWGPNFLEAISHLIELYPEAGVFATNYLRHFVDGMSRGRCLPGFRAYNTWEGLLNRYCEIAGNQGSPIHSSAIAVRRSVLEEIGGFPAGVIFGEDLITWVRLALSSQIAYTSRPCAIYNVRSPHHSTSTLLSLRRVADELYGMFCENPWELRSVACLIQRQYYGLALLHLERGDAESAKQCLARGTEVAPAHSRSQLAATIARAPGTGGRVFAALLRRVREVRDRIKSEELSHVLQELRWTAADGGSGH